MKNLFNYENGVMRTINAIADSLVLGILWVFCSLPVFTIGASSAAFYYAYNKCICQKTDYVFRTFFAGFRSNFKQATQIWLIVLGISLVLGADWYLLRLIENAASLVPVIRTLLVAAMAAVIVWALYLFPYLSRFENTNRHILKNCALIAVANIPQSILLLVLFFLLGVGFVSFPLLNLLIPALYMFCANKIQEKVFRKYMPEEETDKL